LVRHGSFKVKAIWGLQLLLFSLLVLLDFWDQRLLENWFAMVHLK